MEREGEERGIKRRDVRRKGGGENGKKRRGECKRRRELTEKM
jgi:hypothetical protein